MSRSKALTGERKGWCAPEPVLSVGVWEEGNGEKAMRGSLFLEEAQTCSVSKETLCHIEQWHPPSLSREVFVQ